MPQVVAESVHVYDGKQRAVGERYDAEARLVPVLEHLRFARLATPAAPAVDAIADATESATPAVESPRARRKPRKSTAGDRK